MPILSDYMQEDHVQIDAIADRALAAAGAGNGDSMAREGAQFLARLQVHIDMEEKLLFPAFEERTGMTSGGPSVQMREEHVQMQPALEQMKAAIAAQDTAGYQRAAHALTEILMPHNMKEEQMMYPMLDDTVTGADATALLAEVRKMAL